MSLDEVRAIDPKGVLDDLGVPIGPARLKCALLACGGIYTASHLFQALEAGANAVQIDGAVWTEPALPGWLLARWQAVQAA